MRRALPFLLLSAAAVAGGPDLRDPPPAARWILHFDPGLSSAPLPTYRALVAGLPAGTPLTVLAPSAADAAHFGAQVGGSRPFDVVATGEPLTAWARDRYVFFRRGAATCLLLPRCPDEDGPRLGDLEAARRLARELGPDLHVLATDLMLEGGDLLWTRDDLFIGPGTVAANLAPGRDVIDLVHELTRLFRRRVVVLGGAGAVPPHEHIDMYVAALGRRTVLVGDPALARRLLRRPCGEEPWAAAYDAVAGELAALGYRVSRVPAVHAPDGRFLTWTNAPLARVGMRRRAYVPVYGVRALDGYALAIWRAHDYEAVPVPAAALAGLGGAVRCLTQTVPQVPPRGRRLNR